MPAKPVVDLLFEKHPCYDNVFLDGPKTRLELQFARGNSRCPRYAVCELARAGSNTIVRNGEFCVLESSTAILRAQRRTDLSLQQVLERFIAGIPMRAVMIATHDRKRFAKITKREEMRERLLAMASVLAGIAPVTHVTCHQVAVNIPGCRAIPIRQE